MRSLTLLLSANTQAKEMKSFGKLLVFFLLASVILSACGGETAPTAREEAPAETTAAVLEDVAASLVLDMDSETVKQEVTVKNFVDGDTVHFHVPESVMADGVLKARFLAVNTPESTGKIEEYGKAASNYTREKLSAATSIVLESETAFWNPDSTGDRYLVWVWYKTAEDQDYRNLNAELLQEGLARPNSSSENRYGEICMAAIAEAKEGKKNLYSGQPDPDYYYGDAVELTLRELRTNIADYSGMKVAFSGVVIANSGTQGIYVEAQDPETGMYNGIYIYYGHGLNGTGLDILTVGNEVRIVGTVQYYEGGGTWQISDLNYRMMQPDDPGNIQKLSSGHSPAWVLTDPDTFVNGKYCYKQENGDEIQFVTVPYAEMVLGTSIEMQNLTVVDAYTTNNGGSSDGAITLTCEADGVTVTVRTAVLLDENNERVTADAFLGKTIDVRGIVDLYDGTCQIKVFAANNITIK